MMSGNSPQIPVRQSIWSLIVLLVQLFTLGIFSVQGGAKAWFELVLVTAALCACGYLLWWQIPLLILTIILATLAAGMFSVLFPYYLETYNFTTEGLIAPTLQYISEHNINQISNLSGSKLRQRLRQIHEAQQIFERYPNFVEQVSEIQSFLNDINQTFSIGSERVVAEQEAYAHELERVEELDRQQREAERRRQEREAEVRVQQERIRVQQERARAVAREREEQAATEQRRIWLTWLYEQRRLEKFTGGCPPDERYDPPRCRPGYPVKVTLNKKEDGFDGIIWKPSDTEYNNVIPRWCYSSIQEAEAEAGKYKFRRPRDSQGRLRP